MQPRMHAVEHVKNILFVVAKFLKVALGRLQNINYWFCKYVT